VVAVESIAVPAAGSTARRSGVGGENGDSATGAVA
jgi:hypothetical protein